MYDGDTVTADIDLGFGVMLTKQKLRLSRVKAPEIRGPERSKGLKSRNALREKIDKKWVILESDGKSKGKYGRWLVSLYIDGSSASLASRTKAFAGYQCIPNTKSNSGIT